MKKIITLLLAISLTGCFGPKTFDATNKETIKSTTTVLKDSLPTEKQELLINALKYFSVGGKEGIQAALINAFNKKAGSPPAEIDITTNLKPLHGKTAEEILTIYTQKLAKDKLAKKEREKVRALTKEAEALLSSNKFQQALDKYKEMSLIKSGLKASEKGIAKTNFEMKSFAEKTNYIEKIKITEFIATRIDTYLKKDVVAVRIGLKNTGERSLDKVKATVFFQDDKGNNIYEEDFNPVLVSKYSRDKPLKPGYSYEMEKNRYSTIKSPLTDWSKGKATIKIVDISFSK